MTSVADQAVFQSVEAALFFAFLMEGQPVLQKSISQIVFEHLSRMAGRVDADDTPRTINFSGLTRLEIRGQCAMVRAAVEYRLPAPEAAAVHAYYGRAGQQCKADGIQAVRDYCLPLLSIKGEDPTLAMAWGVFGEKRQREFLSQRKIAREFGLSQSTVCRDMKHIRYTGDVLCNRAVERLRPMFAQQGLAGAGGA